MNCRKCQLGTDRMELMWGLTQREPAVNQKALHKPFFSNQRVEELALIKARETPALDPPASTRSWWAILVKISGQEGSPKRLSIFPDMPSPKLWSSEHSSHRKDFPEQSPVPTLESTPSSLHPAPPCLPTQCSLILCACILWQGTRLTLSVHPSSPGAWFALNECLKKERRERRSGVYNIFFTWWKARTKRFVFNYS